MKILTQKVNANEMLVEPALGELETDQFVSYDRGNKSVCLESLGGALRGLIYKYR